MGSNIGRVKIELAAEEQDAHAEVLEAAEPSGVGLDGLDDRVKALGGGIGDAVLGVVQQPVAVAPQPAPEPVRVVAQPAAPEKVTLSADLLFAFNSATLKDAGKEKLDELAARLRGTDVEEIRIVGHADRIGSDAYNQRISEQRASAVKEYLLKTASVQNIRTAGMGKAQPVTGDACKRVQMRPRLIECLQPDRRVDIEIFGTRAASTGASAVRVKAD